MATRRTPDAERGPDTFARTCCYWPGRALIPGCGRSSMLPTSFSRRCLRHTGMPPSGGGRSVGEQAAWLRQILARNLANILRICVGKARCGPREAAPGGPGRVGLTAGRPGSSPSSRRQPRMPSGTSVRFAWRGAGENCPEPSRAVCLRDSRGCSLAEIGERLWLHDRRGHWFVAPGLGRLREQLHEME